MTTFSDRGTSRGGGRGFSRGGGSQDQGQAGRGRGGPAGGSGGGRGRGRGRQFTDDQLNQVVVPRRETTIQVAGEGTDDVVIAPAGDEALLKFAGGILRWKEFPGFNGQRTIRKFVNSLLLNLSNHHTVDTSDTLRDMASTSGLARLTDIMLWPIALNAGDDKDTLSFQNVVLPLIGVLTRERVCQTTMTKESGLIYSTVYLHQSQFLTDGVMRCMAEAVNRRSIEDCGRRFGAGDPSEAAVRVTPVQYALLAIVRLFYQLVKRMQLGRFELSEAIRRLHTLSMDCIRAIHDTAEAQFANKILDKEVTRLLKIVTDADENIIRPIEPSSVAMSASSSSKNRNRHVPSLAHLSMAYDPPGSLSAHGPRHDNDCIHISDIHVLPTRKEVICTRAPFLPSNDVPNAPHFLPAGWKRQLDTHFRLYREDMLDSLRNGIHSFLKLLDRMEIGAEDMLLQQKVLRKHLDDNVNLNVYGNVKFVRMETSKDLGGTILISFQQPGQILSQPVKRRKEFWERSKRRLMQGGLICFVRRSDRHAELADDEYTGPNFEMILAVITRRAVEDLAKDDQMAQIHISLEDNSQYLTMLHSTAARASSSLKFEKHPWFLVESAGAFFESYRPILHAIQKCEPAFLPFGKYLAPTTHEQTARVTIDPPQYALAPGFSFDLSVLTPGRQLRLETTSTLSIADAIKTLQSDSSLDDTQATALVETLCREVSLISGPPGTGKTKIGIDLLRVLLSNKASMNCGPILCICYTNHALDQFLEHLLNEGVRDIVRIGSRSKSERLADYNIASLMSTREKPFQVREALSQAHESWKVVSKEITDLETAFRSEILPWDFLMIHLLILHPDHADQLEDDYGVGYQFQASEDPGETIDDGFETAHGGRGKARQSRYEKWITCADLQQMQKFNADNIANQNGVVQQNRYSVLDKEHSDKGRHHPQPQQHVPTSNRPLHDLTGNVWAMSEVERKRLHDSWKPAVHDLMMGRMEEFLRKSKDIQTKKDQAFDEMRRSIVRGASVIGMTTNGAAKMQALIGNVAPKIIICEEAGEVLECHIMAALTPSTQHLILIGDHLQLRPQIETYNLSSDSKIGVNYNLDKSLFERLVTSQTNRMPLSPLTIQRRMRPEISNLIRTTLYPRLEDGAKVLEYPNVSGMAENLYFMDHAHAEDMKDLYGMQSHANMFEVRMVEALALYLIKNGYDQPGDIAVLTPYLGQLSKLRDHLRKSFMLVIDDRDLEQLEEEDMKRDADDLESEITMLEVNEHVKVRNITLQNHLTLRTIDNYQGEEAKIVIISLVRSDSMRNGPTTGTIGFLKSPNRTNVLLSRAQHGMYILGKADLMDQPQNGIWPAVINELREHDRIGEGFPIVCKNHLETMNIVHSPEFLKTVAPNGGCTEQCGKNMPCGHACPLQCHPDDPGHRLVKCHEPCPRLHKGCLHPCPKECGDSCGDCMRIVTPMALKCGHILEEPRCFEKKDPSKVICKEVVTRKLSKCEHTVEMICHMSTVNVQCRAPCGVKLECDHQCSRSCFECQKLSPGGHNSKDKKPISRTVHGPCKTKCERNQLCGHACSQDCHKGTPCLPCKDDCGVSCAHFKCQYPCDFPCAACCKPCVWSCPHQGPCHMPCGAPCDRLPCDLRCTKPLGCGHQCPSLCSETCPAEKFCVDCQVDPVTMDMLVDVVMQQTLKEIDLDEDPILVFNCGHALTRSSLDGLMEMQVYYNSVTDKKTGDVTFVSKKDLPDGDDLVRQISCHLCRKPIVQLLRYGRRVKHTYLFERNRRYQSIQQKDMREAQDEIDGAQLVIESKTRQFLEVLADVPSVPMLSAPDPKARKLGQYAAGSDLFPNVSFLNIHKTYEIPKGQEDVWNKQIKYLWKPLNRTLKIHQSANATPTRTLFEAAVSHVYRLKTNPTFDPLQYGDKDMNEDSMAENEEVFQEVIQECIRECGLPADGRAGPTFVDSLEAATNALILVLHQANKAMDKAGANTGWYWFVEDAIRCANTLAELHKKAALRGKYSRKATYGHLNQMTLVYEKMAWLSRRDPGLGLDEEEAKKARDQRLTTANRLMQEFMNMSNELETVLLPASMGILEESIGRAGELRERLENALDRVKGVNVPLTEEERVSIFKAITATLQGSGHWYRCSNGHTYVIANCGMAMEESTCPECGVAVGGTSHTLLQDNAPDAEFEALYNRG